jgi:hypothetical protein
MYFIVLLEKNKYQFLHVPPYQKKSKVIIMLETKKLMQERSKSNIQKRQGQHLDLKFKI